MHEFFTDLGIAARTSTIYFFDPLPPGGAAAWAKMVAEQRAARL